MWFLNEGGRNLNNGWKILQSFSKVGATIWVRDMVNGRRDVVRIGVNV